MSAATNTGTDKVRWSGVARFLRHYVEMVVVMLLGMLVLGGALVAVAAVFGVGTSEVREDAPALLLSGMAFSMTAPMVWWMRRRGHSAAATWQMAAAMVLPSVATLGLLWPGGVDDVDTLLEIQHMAMFPAMFVAMLVRRDEYTHDHDLTARG